MKVIFLGCGYLGYNLYSMLRNQFETEMWGIDSPYVSKVHASDFKEVNVFDRDELSKMDFKDAVVIDTVALVANNAKAQEETKALGEIVSVYQNLLEVLKQGGCKRFVYFSSGGTIYGNSDEPLDENSPLNPLSLYAKSKAVVEKAIQESGIDYLILRLSNPYGGYQISGKKQGVIPILIRKALSENVFEMWASGDSVRDYFYIDDMAQALSKLIEADIHHEIVNVGSGIGTSLNTVIETIEQATGKVIHIEQKESDVPVVQSIVLNIDKLKRLTGYQPTVDFKQGITLETKRILKEQDI